MTDITNATDDQAAEPTTVPTPAAKPKATKKAPAKKVQAEVAAMAKPPTKKYDFTAAKIGKYRDKDQLSWAAVAKALDLASPSAARRAYSVLVRPHVESVLTRFPNGAGRKAAPAFTPVDLADITTVKAAREAITGKLVQVAPLTDGGKPRTLFVGKVSKFNSKAGSVDVTDAEGKSHTLALANITGAQ